jgi:hypothetical protein
MSTNRRERLTLVLGAVVLLVGGLDAMQVQHYVVAVPSIVAALLNLVALRLLTRAPRFTAVALQVLNFLVAVAMAVDAINSGKHYIQYAWMLAAATFLIAAAIRFHRSRVERP